VGQLRCSGMGQRLPVSSRCHPPHACTAANGRCAVGQDSRSTMKS